MIFNQIDFLIFETALVMTSLDFISQFICKNDILKQYTMWNMYIFLKYIYTKDHNILPFITTNFINIFITFHSFFVIQPELLTLMPAKMNLSPYMFFIQNFIFHIFPPFYCLIQSLRHFIYMNPNIHMYCISFSFFWILIVEKGTLKLDGIYSVEPKYRNNLLLLHLFLHIFISKTLFSIKMI